MDKIVEKIRESFRYDVRTGKLYNNFSRGRAKAGVEAGCVWTSKDGNVYLIMQFWGKRYYVHRVVWAFVYGRFPDGQIDHVDGDGTNNRIENLRDVTNSENGKNTKMHRNNVSGRVGVGWFKPHGMWRARICVNHKDVTLGYFHSKEDAMAAREKGEREYGFHKNHGRRT